MVTILLEQDFERKGTETPTASAGFESIGDILRRLRLTRRDLEQRIQSSFDAALSQQLDAIHAAEEYLETRR